MLFEIDDSVLAILMSETDAEGARIALTRFAKACPGNVNLAYGIGSYPEDGTDVRTLMASTSRRLNESAASAVRPAINITPRPRWE